MKIKGIRALVPPTEAQDVVMVGIDYLLIGIVALSAIMGYLKDHQDIEQVRFVLFSTDVLKAYEKALRDLTGQGA